MSRLMQVLTGAVGLVFLPIILAIALIFATLSSIDQAVACTPPDPATVWAFPVADHTPKVKFSDDILARHYAVDFAGKEGDPVVASKAGRVIAAGGDTVKIQHTSPAENGHPKDDVQTWYVGLKNLKVHTGETVTTSQQVGELNAGSGSGGPGTGSVELPGPHVHFVTWMNDPDEGHHERDPMDFLEDKSQPNQSGCGCGGGSNGPLVGNDNQQKAFNFLIGKGYTKEQSAGVVGNMIVESVGVNPMEKQGTPYGDHTSSAEVLDYGGGWGIVQWTPPSKMINPSRNAGKSFQEIDTLEYQLDFLWRQLEGQTVIPEGAAGQALKAATSVEQASDAFAGKYERFLGHEDPSSPTYDERRKMARAVLQKFGAGAPGTPDAAGGCQVTGEIAQTALSLAWDTKGHGINQSDAKPTYQQAMPKYNPGPAAAHNYPYSDCGVFVATTVRMSFDPNYQERGTTLQMQYVRAHPDKYQIIEDPKSTAQLQPGDIMLSDHHTYIYTGDYQGGDGKYNAASASWACESGQCAQAHVPQASTWYYESGYWAVRAKKG
ncbi:MAG TPA: phage tail tip lysozyme [Kribbellaceae bacterium]|jgi:hypothetical protein